MLHARLLDSNVFMFTFENMLDEDVQLRYPGARLRAEWSQSDGGLGSGWAGSDQIELDLVAMQQAGNRG